MTNPRDRDIRLSFLFLSSPSPSLVNSRCRLLGLIYCKRGCTTTEEHHRHERDAIIRNSICRLVPSMESLSSQLGESLETSAEPLRVSTLISVLTSFFSLSFVSFSTLHLGAFWDFELPLTRGLQSGLDRLRPDQARVMSPPSHVPCAQPMQSDGHPPSSAP